MSSISMVLLLAASAFSDNAALAAGNRVGNGGDAVICEKGKKSRVDLLDFYEADLDVKVRENESEVSFARDRLRELSRLDPRLANQFEVRLNSIREEIEFRTGVSLLDVKDSNHLHQPRVGCRVVQLAIKRAKPLPGEKHFLIDQDTWAGMNAGSKAGLLVHEIAHEYFTKLGEEDSRKARSFNARLFRGDFATLSEHEYWKWIQQLKLPHYP